MDWNCDLCECECGIESLKWCEQASGEGCSWKLLVFMGIGMFCNRV